MRINMKAFVLSCGIIWGIGLFGMTWWMIAFDAPDAAGEFLAIFYKGYSLTPMGSLVGFGWAFVDGVFVGALFGWLYNFLVGRMGKKQA